ncbi:hypothetical protein SLE2022_243170 [Rubroshorea leprosula]
MKFIRDFPPFLPLVLCFSFLHLLSATDSNATTVLIANACKNAQYKDLCIQSLQADEASKDSDLRGLVLLTIRLAAANGSDTSVHIKMLLKDTSALDPVIEQCLNDCSDHYLSAIEQLNDSIAALLAGASEDVEIWVEAAISDAESCEDGFKQYSEKQSVISERNSIFRKLCSNVLGINKVLAQGN